MRRARSFLLALFAGALAGGGCNAPGAAPGPGPGPAASPLPAQTGFEPAPTRGYILISIDALRADHLGLYGYPKPTSPFLDELARRATVFDHAFAQVPSTLPSHMSMFTGLYPAEHGVFPPSSVLAPEIRTLPEILLHAGFRTAGHTEGGYVQGGYGFARGFGEWTDTPYVDDTDVERTFAHGVAFLKSLKPSERFFLFLHSYTVHDPYWPPEQYRQMFWPGPPPPSAGEPSGPHFAAINNGLEVTTPAAVDYYEAMYDASIRYLDDALRQLFADLEASGLAADTTVILTSDHGEEFFEHGKLVHTQIYPECLHIPLLVVHPAQRAGLRIGRLAQTIDFAPTIYDLAGVTPPPGLSGASLKPLLQKPERAISGEAYAEVKVLAFRRPGALCRTQRQAHAGEPGFGGHGIRRPLGLEGDALRRPAADARIPRRGVPSAAGDSGVGRRQADDPAALRNRLAGIPPRASRRRPQAPGESHDPGLRHAARARRRQRRPLSVVQAPRTAPRTPRALRPDRRSPGGARPLHRAPRPLRELLARLESGYRHQLRTAPADQALTEEQIKNLRALGYLR